MKKLFLSQFFALFILSVTNATVINYSTYLGGNLDDSSCDIDITDNNEALVIGSTGSIDFPTTTGSLSITNNGGATDIFISKLSINGDSLKFSTYLGGSDMDRGFSISIDGNGSSYVTGYTNSIDFPTQNAYDSSYNGNSDIYLSKISVNGDSLEFSTFFGGSGLDKGYSIILDINDKPYITGRTDSNDFPTQNAFDSSNNGGDDIFISKFSVNLDSLEFSTYIGGSNSERGYSIKVDDNGNSYITGRTSSIDFPVQNAFDNSHNGGYDAFVLKLSSFGDSLQYSTYLGGIYADMGFDITLDSNNIYIIGTTNSNNFPTQNAFNSTKNGLEDIFITKISNNNYLLEFSTFFGSTGQDWGYGVSVDENSNIFVSGYTSSNNFPTQFPILANNSGNLDIFVSQFNSLGSNLEFSTYLGGSSYDQQVDVGNPNIFKNGKLYLISTTESSDFTTSTGAYDINYNGGTDAIVTSLQFSPVLIPEFENQAPSNFTLNQNYPNPFNPSTKIKFSLKEQAEIKLTIVNLNGKFVKELVSGKVSKGSHTATWDGTNSNGKLVSNGIYISRLESEGTSISKKLTLLK